LFLSKHGNSDPVKISPLPAITNCDRQFILDAGMKLFKRKTQDNAFLRIAERRRR